MPEASPGIVTGYKEGQLSLLPVLLPQALSGIRKKLQWNGV
jgi:hypothetical protein